MPLNNPPPAVSAKAKLETRAMDTASGDVAYTGYGFTPNAILIIATEAAYGGGSVGSSEPAESSHCSWFYGTGPAFGKDAFIVLCGTSAALCQKAIIKSYDVDLYGVKGAAGRSRSKIPTIAGISNAARRQQYLCQLF